MILWPKVREELNVIVNRHFETPEYKQLFSVRLTPARQKIWDLHYPHYIKSRRDCWGAAAVNAPLDVKRAIWEHEKDELIFDPRMGSAHLTDEQMAEAAAESNLLPGATGGDHGMDVFVDDSAVDRSADGQSHHGKKKQSRDRQRRRFYGSLRAQARRRSGWNDRRPGYQHKSAYGGRRRPLRYVRADLRSPHHGRTNRPSRDSRRARQSRGRSRLPQRVGNRDGAGGGVCGGVGARSVRFSFKVQCSRFNVFPDWIGIPISRPRAYAPDFFPLHGGRSRWG